ncbi:MAG TPA: ester cyclase [Thermoleophilaceae bacterium]|nr:ester cyclase [Thermoleophilaceae bacterium]
MVTDDAGNLVRRLHAEILAVRDPGVVDAFFAPDFVSHTNPPGFPEGVEGVRRFFAMFRDAMPDVEVTIAELIVDGDRAAVATTIRGTHTGDLLGLPATGRRVEVIGVDMVRVLDGKIVEHRGLTDTVGLMRQLGGAA